MSKLTLIKKLANKETKYVITPVRNASKLNKVMENNP